MLAAVGGLLSVGNGCAYFMPRSGMLHSCMYEAASDHDQGSFRIWNDSVFFLVSTPVPLTPPP